MGFFSALSLIHTRAKMHLKANAAQTYLSYLWWLLEPALYVALFYVVFEVLMLRGGPGFLYFLILGKIPFLWVSKSLSSGANSIRSNRGLMGQVRLPIGILPYTPLLEAVYKQVFVFAFLGIFLSVSLNLTPTMHWWSLLAVVVVNMLFIIAITLPFSWLVAVIPDVSQLLPMVTMFLMFTSGIFFDVNDIADPVLRDAILTYQPLAFLIDAYRAVLLRGELPDVSHLVTLAVVFSLLIALWHLWFVRTHHFVVRRALHS
ncbi:ABC transporter permease [Luminiphilus sp.]|nr:ABC transporter permease [Luminiphilus sp.]